VTPEPASNPVEAFIAFGSNLGDRLAHMRAAFEMLDAHDSITCTARSSLYETAAVGGPPGQGPYLNAAVAIRTILEPAALLARCLQIESHLGRVRSEPWGPRTIDLDLLLYSDRIVESESLIVPHPRMHERRFVLVPLAEIAPAAMHPVLRCSVSTLLNRIPITEESIRRVYAADWASPVQG
jgi:2-amino-4-hydroxy-6-hydroxymethyldihydropteridine diphosphokinase